MGALLVVLVAVSRSARDSAERDLDAKRATRATLDPAMQKKMNDVHAYMGSLHKVRSDAEGKLRDEHTRLSHVEDHIRRLQEKMRSLQVAAVELEAIEKEHYDDREQADRETTRLNQLIEESKKTISSLQDSAATAPGSYAVVPYEGPNGTYRRPIYIECVKEGVILQPEGVKIDATDLRPPYGPGNPLAAVLRASRDHMIKLYPKEGERRELEPYPLLLVRSQGLIMFDRARQAIEAGDFDLGFELVEDDWKLKFPQPDPQLAALQQQTLVQARARQEVLAAAAPRAYRSGSLTMEERYGLDDGPSSDDDFAPDIASSSSNEGKVTSGGHVSVGAGGDGNSTPLRGNSTSTAIATSGGGSRGGAAGNGPAFGTSGMSNTVAASGGNSGQAEPTGNGGTPDSTPWGSDYGSAGESSQGGGGAIGPNMTAGGGGGGSGGDGRPMPPPDPNAPPEMNQQQGVSMTYGSSPGSSQNLRDSKRGKNDSCIADTRGKDWALRQKPQRATPVRRTIRVIVREDQLAILPDDTSSPAAVAHGKVLPLKGDTVESLDEFVKHVRDQIDGWGIAGNGLYWRPVIVLNVAPQAQRRADDLERLLRNSGLELRTDETANNALPRKVQ